MAENIKPYLCGGVLFFLLTQMKPSKNSARNHQSGIKDDHSNPVIMTDLILAIKGDETYVSAQTAKRDVSDYCQCKMNGSVNIPFNDVSFCKSYDLSVKNNYPDTLERMSRFVNAHLDLTKKEWFVKAMLDIIENDEDILETTQLYVDSLGIPHTKEEIRTMSCFTLSALLVGVVHFILTERKDGNTNGISTLNAWSEYIPHKPRRYTGDAGSRIKRDITVETEIPSTASKSQDESLSAEENMDAEVLDDDMTSDTATDNAESTKPSVQIIEKATVVNQYGENCVHIDHVDTFKL